MDFRRRQSPQSLTSAAFAAATLISITTIALAQAASLPQTTTASPSDARIDSLIDSLNQVRTPTTVAIAPDGKQLAWAMYTPQGSELHLVPLASDGSPKQDEPERLISPDTIPNPANQQPGTCPSSHPAWSPDGKQLAFLSKCAATDSHWQPTAQDDIFVLTLSTNSIQQVSHLHGEVSSLEWSPDNKSIAFLYVEGATRRAGALDAMKPWSGVIGEDGVEVQRVYRIEVSTGNAAPLTPFDLHVYEFAWSPNSSSIAFVAAAPPGENNWWVARLYETQPEVRQADKNENVCVYSASHESSCLGMAIVLFDPNSTKSSLHGLQIAVPRYSPDGKQIAFIGGLMSDQGATGGDIYLIPATGLPAGTEPQNLTPGRAASPAYIGWLTDSILGVTEHVGGSTHITAIDAHSGKDVHALNLTLPETIISGTDTMSISVAHHSTKAALIRQSFTSPPEVWAGPITYLRQVTHLNDALHPTWGKAESIDYSNGGFHIQGWLLYPAGWDPNHVDPAKKYPLIVSVHGGPSSAVTPHWPSATYGPVPFSALDYFVFLPNPRGSFGQGEKFTQANVRDFGYGDLSDILAGIDVLEKRFPIDTHREGITGWSYGGFMTMFAVTQTTRFQAAVAGAGIANWLSYYGENSIDQWMIPFFGASVYDDSAIYAKSSAINFIQHAKTPTLIVVGDRDGECPAPQSFEFWHALKAEGVKTQLVVYPNEGHRFTDADHQRDVLKRALNWFDTQMPAQ
jgi:dipeptidyl aminopeptidase/acylaminoacyl peptidase